MEHEKKKLYRWIAEHTWALCEKVCPKKETSARCCFDDQCGAVAKGLRAKGLPVPERVGEVRFLGPEGCIIEPWQRPICAEYHCMVRDIGPPGEQVEDKEWLRKYFNLKRLIRE
jgi:hypothetical protein